MTTIQEIFEMRKNGQFEEAYNAVLPMYREHHGHYTTLCMFWTATDVMRLRIDAGRCAEAEQIFAALRALYPNLQDRDQSAAHTLNRLALMLATKEQEMRKLQQYHKAMQHEELAEQEPLRFSLLDYMTDFGKQYLSENDWLPSEFNGHTLPSFATKIICRIFHEVVSGVSAESQRSSSGVAEASAEQLESALSWVRLGLDHDSRNKHLRRYQANLLYRLGEKEQAIAIYRQITRYSRDSYLFSEMASMLDDQQEQAALLAKAIQCQRTEVFAQKDRMTLAALLKEMFPQHAAYELQQVVQLRTSLGQQPSKAILSLQTELADITPVSAADQHEFYQRLIANGAKCA